MPHITRSGVKIWWDSVGEGPAMLLIQGLGYPSDASWRILPALATQHRVIILDNRGVGRSDSPASSWTIETMAADAAAVLEAAGVPHAHVAGFSMGGVIAQELALSRPDLVCTLTLGCTSPGGADAVPLTAEVAEKFTDWGNLPAAEAAWQASTVCYAPTTPHDEIEADISVRMPHNADRRGYLHQLQAIAEYSGAGERLHEWTGPTLVVHGGADLIVPVENAEVLRRRIPHASVRIFAGAGHILMTDARDDLADAMLGFMGDTGSRCLWSAPIAAIAR